MLRKVLLVALCGIVIAGCSDPKSAVVPQDLSKLDTLKPALDKLSPEEKELLQGYLMRKAVGERLGGILGALSGSSAGVPPGLTVGEAIEDQRKFAADRAVETTKALALKQKLEHERASALKAMRNVLTVTLVSKRWDEGHKLTYVAMDEGLAVVFGYQNNGAKDIAAVKGRIVTRDLLGDEISVFQVSNDKTIPAGKSSTWSGTRLVMSGLSQNNDRKLADLPDDKYTVEWEPEIIVFADGTKLTAADAKTG